MNSECIPEEFYDKEEAMRGGIGRAPNAITPASQREAMRAFDTGATRNDDSDELDYEGFLSPLALKAFAEYMHRHRRQSDGQLRGSDNWQAGIPLDSYAKSMFRHFMDFWLHHDGYGEDARENAEDALCGLLFNVQGYLHELKKL